ncbi:exported protein of unknown function [Streptomyces sp. KY70]|nr:exported protein of unknown function [Streptomyces sp. KY70]
MPHRPHIPSPGRRTVLRGSLLVPAAVALPAAVGAAPALALAGRPEAAWGVQVGGRHRLVGAGVGAVGPARPDAGGDRGVRVLPPGPALARAADRPRVGLHRHHSPVRPPGGRAGALPGHVGGPGRSAPYGKTGVRNVPYRSGPTS